MHELCIIRKERDEARDRVRELEAALTEIATAGRWLDFNHTDEEAIEHFSRLCFRYREISRDALGKGTKP